MGSDSISNVSAPAFSKEFGKKKRTNRLAKLKQCKLDARREQWLSQAKNKGFKEESSISGGPSPSSSPSAVERGMALGNFDTRRRGEENDGSGSSFHDSDLDSLANSPRSSGLGGNDVRKSSRPGSSCGSSSSSSGSSSSFCFGNISGEEEEEEEEDDCLDDWEAVADALTADENQSQPISESLVEVQTPIVSDNHPVSSNKGCKGGILDPKQRGQIQNPMQAVIIAIAEEVDVPVRRILEADGRCPGCRKLYDPVRCEIGFSGSALPFRLARSCSINTRILEANGVVHPRKQDVGFNIKVGEGLIFLVTFAGSSYPSYGAGCKGILVKVGELKELGGKLLLGSKELLVAGYLILCECSDRLFNLNLRVFICAIRSSNE
ncbi:hypothetical protein Syun_023940 [Stephania yunnanensis]|uniref:Uncharacterized protein n=1 Tax=Stephania yunnanensis TaxID=152371 RepID=A0AAP0FAU3_9MAGN